jgi:hypothetical protein
MIIPKIEIINNINLVNLSDKLLLLHETNKKRQQRVDNKVNIIFKFSILIFF